MRFQFLQLNVLNLSTALRPIIIILFQGWIRRHLQLVNKKKTYLITELILKNKTSSNINRFVMTFLFIYFAGIWIWGVLAPSLMAASVWDLSDICSAFLVLTA